MKILLHTCCAPCSISVIEKLRNDEHDVTGFWYNPNIHPFTEYMNRLEALKRYAKMIELDVIYDEEYGLRGFVTSVIEDLNHRCSTCYLLRLDEVAKAAKEKGFDAFTTTLLVSPYQNHEMIKKVGEKIAEKHGVKFYYEDFRPTFKNGKDKAHQKELYMQKYCGCVFSEEERYTKKKRRA